MAALDAEVAEAAGVAGRHRDEPDAQAAGDVVGTTIADGPEARCCSATPGSVISSVTTVPAAGARLADDLDAESGVAQVEDEGAQRPIVDVVVSIRSSGIGSRVVNRA